MREFQPGRFFVLCCLGLAVSFSGVGCKDGPTMPEIPSFTEDDPAESPVSKPGGMPAQLPPPAPGIPEPTPPTPEELVAQFKVLKPHEVSDTSLALVTSQPEAAAMIEEIETKSGDFTAGGIVAAAKMPNLVSLKIQNAKLGPADLKNLAEIKSLKTLHISGSQTDDSVVESLAGLTELETLDVSGTKITPASASAFSQMKNLKTVDLRGTQSDDTTVAALSGLSIRGLDLAKTRISNASMPMILKFGDLEELDVSFTGVTGDAFKGAGRTSIKVLNVSETRFGTPGFVNIKGMKALEDLNIYRAGLVEDRAANVFKTFPKLKILNAGSNSITDAGMAVFFKGHRSLQVLRLGHNKKITDNGLAALVAVKTLKQLELTGTACGANGAKALKERLPECSIITPAGAF